MNRGHNDSDGGGDAITPADDMLLDQTMRRCITAIDHAAAQAARSYQLRLECEIALTVFVAAAVCAFTPELLPGTWRMICGGVAAITLAVVAVAVVSSLRLSRDAHQHVQKVIAEQFPSSTRRP